MQNDVIQLAAEMLVAKWRVNESMANEIVDTIRAAVAAERERCAQIARTWLDPDYRGFSQPGDTGCMAAINEGLQCSACEGIARAIEGATK